MLSDDIDNSFKTKISIKYSDNSISNGYRKCTSMIHACEKSKIFIDKYNFQKYINLIT